LGQIGSPRLVPRGDVDMPGHVDQPLHEKPAKTQDHARHHQKRRGAQGDAQQHQQGLPAAEQHLPDRQEKHGYLAFGTWTLSVGRIRLLTISAHRPSAAPTLTFTLCVLPFLSTVACSPWMEATGICRTPSLRATWMATSATMPTITPSGNSGTSMRTRNCPAWG